MKSRRILSLILCLALLLFHSAPAQAASTVISEGAFDYRITDAGAEVIGYYYSGSSQVVVPSQVQGYPVVAIGDEVFRNLDGITAVTLPEGLQTLGDRAFYACSDLVTVNLPQSLRTIGEMAFGNCYGLLSVYIPENVSSIGLSAFLNCTALQSLQVAEGNPSFAAVDNVLFTADMTVLLAYPNAGTARTYQIPAQVQKIGEKAFLECVNLETVTFPAGLLEIEKYAFSGCTALSAAEIPDSVQKIGNFAFSNCTALTAVTLGQGITTVSSYAFHNCSSLQSVTLPDNLEVINSKAFSGCGPLEQICISDSVRQIWADAFSQTEVTTVRFYSTAQKEKFAHLFPDSQIICLCKDPHTYLEEAPLDCSVCDFVLELEAPELSAVTHDTVQLVAREIYEYSYDLQNWRADGLFTDLKPNQTYQFYARVKGIETSPVSLALTVTTDRAPQEKAPAPVIDSATGDTITLKHQSGCEYSMDGVTWQPDPVFTGLEMNTQYTFYQRYAQTQTHYAGPVSAPATGKTGGMTAVTSQIYRVLEDMVRKIPAGTTVETFLQGLEGGEYCVVYKGETLQEKDALVGTGMVLKLMAGDRVVATYTLLVTGDVSGDGLITITDMIAVKAHILEKTLLKGVYAQAGDTSGDDLITITDFIQIKAQILEKGTITAR